MPDGRRRSASSTNKAEAVALLAELRRQRDNAIPQNPRDLRLGTYLRRWLDDVRPNLAPETWRKHESHCRVHLEPALGHVRLSELSVADIRRYVAGSTLHPQSVRHHRATLRRALADAYRDGLVTRNVAALAEPPKMTKRERPVLTAAQVRILLEGTKDDPLHALWVLAATTGMRLGEMLALTWEDVELGDGSATSAENAGGPIAVDGHDRRQWRGGTASLLGGAPADADSRYRGRSPHVTIHSTLHRENRQWVRRPPKTERSRRTIPLTPLAVEALRALRQRQYEEKVDGRSEVLGVAVRRQAVPRGDGAGASRLRGGAGGADDVLEGPPPISLAARRNSLIFTTRRGQPLTGPNLPKELHKATERLGLPRVRIHDLRHGYAAILLSEGVELITVSRMLGHSSIRITADIYSRVMPNLTLDAAEKMRRAVG